MFSLTDIFNIRSRVVLHVYQLSHIHSMVKFRLLILLLYMAFNLYLGESLSLQTPHHLIYLLEETFSHFSFTFRYQIVDSLIGGQLSLFELI
jgi:hypothetical protein